MNLYIDINSRTAVSGIGIASPVTPLTFKNQDTPALNIYFTLEGVVQDYGAGTAVKFGLNKPPPSPISLLVLETSFVKLIDANGHVYYQGLPIFNTVELDAALGTNANIQCVGEVRTQLSNGEIFRSLDIPFVIWRTILLEAGTPPPVDIPGYPDVSLIELITRKGIAQGYAELDASAKLLLSRIPAGVELITDRDIASGYPSLDANALLDPDQVPIDGKTIVIDAATQKLVSIGPSLAIVALTTEAFIVPALNAQVIIGVPTTQLLSNVFYFVSTAGYYQYVSAVDPGHGRFQNTGATGNAAAGAAIAYGQSLRITGPPGPTGAAAVAGVASLTDAQTAIGQSLIFNASGILCRIIAGTNISLDNTTTVGGIIINSAVGGAGVASLTDASAVGYSIIRNATGVLKRLKAADSTIVINDNTTELGFAIALADAITTSGLSLLGAANGQIKRLIQGSGVTLDAATTPGGIIINASAVGGGVASLTDAETSTGATLISSSTGVLKRLIAGSNITLTPDSPTVGGVTISASGGSGTLNRTQAFRSSNWTYADASVIPWTGINWDTDTKWASANPSRLTIITAGYYQVTVQLSWTGAGGGATNVIFVNVTVNGSTHPKLGSQVQVFGSLFNPSSQLISGVLKLNAADYLEVIPWNQTGPNPTALVAETGASGNSPIGPLFQLDYLGT